MAYRDGRKTLQKGRSLYAPIASFVIACLVLTVLTDLAYWTTTSNIWVTNAVWLLTIGLVATVVAIGAGIIDLVRSRKVLGLGQPLIQIVGHVVAFGLSIVNVFVHSRDGYTAVIPEGLSLSVVVVLVLLATTIVGGSMTARTRVGGLA